MHEQPSQQDIKHCNIALAQGPLRCCGELMHVVRQPLSRATPCCEAALVQGPPTVLCCCSVLLLVLHLSGYRENCL